MAEPEPRADRSGAQKGKRIVLTTFGSLGDLHPYVAIALGLKARGHEPVVATGECYRRKVEALGLGFRAVRPDAAIVSDRAAMRRFMSWRWGTFRVLRDYILPSIHESYNDTLAAVEGGADLLVSHPITFAARLVAQNTGIPWVSTQISPLGLFSAFDPPSLPGFPDFSNRLRFLGPRFWGPLGRSLKVATRSWARPIDRLRSEIGLPAIADNPLVDGHSPALVLALFSRLLAEKQPDWPGRSSIPAFRCLTGMARRIAARRSRGFWKMVRHRSSSRSAYRRRWSPGRSSSRALPPRKVWAAGACSSWARTIPLVQLSSPMAWPRLSTPRSLNCSHGRPWWFMPAASAPVGWRCGPGVPCWWYPTPTTSPTMLGGLPGWGLPASSRAAATAARASRGSLSDCSAIRHTHSGRRRLAK